MNDKRCEGWESRGREGGRQGNGEGHTVYAGLYGQEKVLE